MPTTGGVTALPPEVKDKLAEIDQAKAAAESAKVSAIDTRTMILNDRARQAVTVAQTTESITTLEGAIAALNALSASYEAALPASLADRQALHDRDAAFTVMVADMTAKLERIQALDTSQSSELEAQRRELQTMLGQVQSFLPTRDALAALTARVAALEARQILTGSKTQAMPLLALGGLYSFDIPVTGAKVGMPSSVIYPVGFLDSLSSYSDQVEADGLVKVRLKAGLVLAAGSRVFRAVVFGV